MRRAIALLILVPLVPSAARAWDSQCRPGDIRSQQDIVDSLCAPLSATECESGPVAARGTWWGEHTFIAQLALIGAGLDVYSEQKVLDYYTDASTSLEPTGTRAMSQPAARMVTLAELSQLPDWSYSMADFLLGNEYCLAENSGSDVKACHNFESHMGAVNSTHFAPQNRAVYTLYHNIALAIASRCARMKSAFDAAMNGNLPHPLSGEVQSDNVNSMGPGEVPECEREALGFEAIASHYLADAWSTGHMWQRWGKPQFEATLDDQLKAESVSLVSGLIHGWRSSVASWPVISHLQDDQLSLPGFYNEKSAVQVKFVSPSKAATPGGGDTYFMPCQAFKSGPSAGLSVSLSPELQVQRDTMLACIADGFAEVYKAGPKTRGSIAVGGGSSTGDGCWNQRVTNESMSLGFGISGWDYSRSPAFQARSVIAITQAEDGTGNITRVARTLPYGNQLRIELARLGADMEREARRSPHGTNVAELDLTPSTLLGYSRNSAYSVSGVPYFDAGDPTKWNAMPGADCTKTGYPAHGYATVNADCFPHETAILAAFRAGEAPAWCTNEDEAALSRAARACKAAGGSGAACDACVRVVLPHLRNACDPGSYAPTAKPLDDADRRDLDHRSVCDVYQASGIVTATPTVVHRPYDPLTSGTAETAARAFCTEGRDVSDQPFTYTFSVLPPIPSTDIDAIQFDETRNTCGAGQAGDWWHFNRSKPIDHFFTLAAKNLVEMDGTRHIAAVSDLEMTLWQGPACFTKLKSATGMLTWAKTDPADVCVRVRPLKYTAWSSYEISASAPAGCANLTFAPAVRYGTGQFPDSVVMADLSGDGKLDLATTNTPSKGVSVLLGHGDGTFAFAVNYGVGLFPHAAAVGDFNLDGKPDLAVVNQGNNNTTVLLGVGNGVFGAANSFAAGIKNPMWLSVSDLDLDGKPDLAVLGTDSFVGLLLGKGDGTFKPPTTSPNTVSGPFALAVADLSGDGKPDLAITTARGFGSVAVMLGNGDGTFGPKADYPAASLPRSIAVGDVNGDGIPDLAVGGASNPGGIAVLLGQGGGLFAPAVNYGMGVTFPQRLAIADLNGDGNPDLIGAYYTNHTVSVLLGNGDGTFVAPVEYAAPSGPWGIAAGDLNGDGKLDLAVTDSDGSSLNVLLNTCN